VLCCVVLLMCAGRGGAQCLSHPPKRLESTYKRESQRGKCRQHGVGHRRVREKQMASGGESS
jgi:hypothetical protein